MALILDMEPVDWRAAFAWTRQTGGPGLAVRRFRRSFDLDAVPERLIVRVSADSRYILRANGRFVGRGPEVRTTTVTSTSKHQQCHIWTTKRPHTPILTRFGSSTTA